MRTYEDRFTRLVRDLIEENIDIKEYNKRLEELDKYLTQQP